jgi:hypothetical protein
MSSTDPTSHHFARKNQTRRPSFWRPKLTLIGPLDRYHDCFPLSFLAPLLRECRYPIGLVMILKNRAQLACNTTQMLIILPPVEPEIPLAPRRFWVRY